ncbi:hypothetical protein ACFL27_26490 [candidate division CSSED10-310 bacterium]|uniref:Uncharacterized protein n=1 Tax=candidate division CSSED10-310 bacterium TaxID=2855610 RepID=A0ABV6Z5M9_UNCC1
MPCDGYSVTYVLVELHRIGLVGLKKTFMQVDQSGLSDRDAKLDLMLKMLARENYIPLDKIEAYRTTLWREYLRHKGEDFSDFFSPIQVIVRGENGEERNLFVKTLRSVFSYFELKPLISFTPPAPEGPHPQLVVDDQTIVQGYTNHKWFKEAVKRTISDW